MPGPGRVAADRWAEHDGGRVRYRVRAARRPGRRRGRVLVLPGFTEFVEKHAATADRLAEMGLDSLTIDWPGQGLSGRLAPERPDLVHCDDFDGHLRALGAVARREGYLDGAAPLFLLGHSMGGHLALRMAAAGGAPVAGIVLTSPRMMPPGPPPLTPGLVRALAGGLGRAGVGRWPVAGRPRRPRGGGFDPGNALTRSPGGYRVQPDWWRRDPRLLAYGPSYGWVRSAFASCLATTGDAGWLGGIAVPVQAHLAGDETVVSARHSAALVPRIPDVAIHRYEGARHELLHELPEVTRPLWERVAAFVDGRLEAGRPPSPRA